MFSFDKDYIHTWIIRNGKLIKPLKLKIIEYTGQIITCPLQLYKHINHSSIILGYDINSWDKTIYSCGQTLAGIQIEPLDKRLNYSLTPIVVTSSQQHTRKCLERIQKFLNTRLNRYRYHVLFNNCQSFCHNMVYGFDVNTLLAWSFVLFVFLFTFRRF